MSGGKNEGDCSSPSDQFAETYSEFLERSCGPHNMEDLTTCSALQFVTVKLETPEEVVCEPSMDSVQAAPASESHLMEPQFVAVKVEPVDEVEDAAMLLTAGKVVPNIPEVGFCMTRRLRPRKKIGIAVTDQDDESESRGKLDSDKTAVRTKRKYTKRKHKNDADPDTKPPGKYRKRIYTILPFRCSECDLTWTRTVDFKKHLESAHEQHSNPVCADCGKRYISVTALREHWRRRHDPRGPPPRHQCDQCPRSFVESKHLSEHYLTHTGECPYVCGYCGRPFRHTSALSRHQRLHTGETPYVCVRCDRTFRDTSSLRYHERVHTDVRPHVCSFCGAGYRDASNLKRHMVHHMTGEELERALEKRREANARRVHKPRPNRIRVRVYRKKQPQPPPLDTAPLAVTHTQSTQTDDEERRERRKSTPRKYNRTNLVDTIADTIVSVTSTDLDLPPQP